MTVDGLEQVGVAPQGGGVVQRYSFKDNRGTDEPVFVVEVVAKEMVGDRGIGLATGSQREGLR